jgi:tetratricopeptide (TPR) repeat protein
MVGVAECLTIDRVTAWILANESWDFLAIYYNAIDHLCHHFMPYHPPLRAGISAVDFDLYQGVVAAIYRFLDTVLGRLLERAGPDTAVLLVSDHGFYSDERRPRPSQRSELKNARHWHRPLGVLCFAGPPFKKNEVLHGAGIADITPTVLTLFGLPCGDDMDGVPLVAAFADQPELVRIPSWETVPGECGMHPPGYEPDPWEAGEALKQLADLGYIAYPEGDNEGTLQRLQKERMFHLAVHFLETGRDAEAATQFEELLNDEPANADFLLYLARCRLALGEFDACRKLLGEVTRLAPESAHAEFLLGKVCAALGDHQAALGHFDRVLELDPRLPTLHWTKGQTHLRLKQWPEAERAFRTALELDPDSARAHLGLAHVFLVQNQFEKAAAAARNATQLNYRLADAHYVLGIALARLDQPAPALAAFETCLQIDPKSASAHQWLAALHEQATGDLARAAEHRRRARELAQQHNQ